MASYLRVLLIAPAQPGINNVPEIRMMTAKNSVRVISGKVTAAQLYDACRDQQYDVLHFAAHGDDDFITLSDSEALTADEIVQLARQSKAHLVFFNTCRAGRFAAYLVAKGVQHVIASNVDLPDASAWKMPTSFYDWLSDKSNQQTPVNYAGAFLYADSGDGTYSFLSNISALPVYNDLLVRLADLDGKLLTFGIKVEMLQKLVQRLQYIILALSILLVLTVLALAAFMLVHL